MHSFPSLFFVSMRFYWTLYEYEINSWMEEKWWKQRQFPRRKQRSRWTKFPIDFWIFPMDNFQSIELMRSLMFSFILLNRKQWHTQYDELQWNLVKCPLLFFICFKWQITKRAHTHTLSAKAHRRTHKKKTTIIECKAFARRSI